MQEAKISVILPIYNAEKHLRKCIDSILAQSLYEIEIVLVDDGSTDLSSRICDEYGCIDDRIRVIHKQNGGSGSARNAGLEVASGEYIAFVESDDSVDKDMYSKLYYTAKWLDAEIVKCGFLYIANGEILCEARYLFEISKEGEVFSIKENPRVFLNHPSIWAGIYKKEYIERNSLRFIETPKASYSDYSWMMMTYAYAKRISIIHKSLYFYTYDNPESSHLKAGELYSYMFQHAKNSNAIIKNAGIYDEVKDYVIARCFSACIHSAENVSPENKEDCFRRIRDVFIDIYPKKSGYLRNSKFRSRIINSVMENNLVEFYKLIENEAIVLDSLKGKRIIVFGAGACGLSLIIRLKREKIPYIGWIDNKPQVEYGIDAPSKITSLLFDLIIVAVADQDVYNDIKKQLIGMQISNSKIIWSPYRYESNETKKLVML